LQKRKQALVDSVESPTVPTNEDMAGSLISRTEALDKARPIRFALKARRRALVAELEPVIDELQPKVRKVLGDLISKESEASDQRMIRFGLRPVEDGLVSALRLRLQSMIRNPLRLGSGSPQSVIAGLGIEL